MWELGGHADIAKALAGAEHVFLTYKQVGLAPSRRARMLTIGVHIAVAERLAVLGQGVVWVHPARAGVAVINGLNAKLTVRDAPFHFQVTSATVVVCVDLSDPVAALASARLWLAAVETRLGAVYSVRNEARLYP